MQEHVWIGLCSQSLLHALSCIASVLVLVLSKMIYMYMHSLHAHLLAFQQVGNHLMWVESQKSGSISSGLQHCLVFTVAGHAP